MRRMLKIGLALTLCAALLALGLSALLYSWHECDHEDCPVCLAISASLRLTRMAALVLLARAIGVLLAEISREFGRRVGQRPVTSLVSMKSELLN